MKAIDFDAVNRSLMHGYDAHVSKWLPGGRREGHEYKALNPTRSDSHIGSFSINLNTGAWADFATGDKGSDPVSLYAYLFTHGDQGKAARELAEELRIEAVKDTPGRRESPWELIQPAPLHAQDPPKAHIRRGRPEAVWVYLDAAGRVNGYVYRFKTSDGGKEIIPLTWGRNRITGQCEWRWISFPNPRPLYGLDRLAANPAKPVLVVEGEKCADIATPELPGYVVVTWPGGSKAVSKADWRPLYGKKVVVWPDCDAQCDAEGNLLPQAKQPGWMAAEKIAGILKDMNCKVRIVKIPEPGEKPSGWDIADAVAEGLKGKRLADHIEEAREPAAEFDKPRFKKVGYWEDNLLCRRGEIVSCLSNLVEIFSRSPEWDGVVCFDEFNLVTIKIRLPPYEFATVGEWQTFDDASTAIWITRKYNFAPTPLQVSEAIEVMARRRGHHPVREWLLSLMPWDGINRLDDWISDYLGVDKTEYVSLVSRFYLIGMVARVMEPGVKFDYCLVLEGPQGKGKSSALSILGGQWFGDTDLDLHNKDSMSALRGKWLYEFAELGSLSRAEASKQKSFISRQIDEFRPAYGRREIRCPRQVVFAGTTNDWQWNKDATGGRRFWPVCCVGEFNLDGLQAVRDQLFAQALARYQAKERFWPTWEEQKALFDPEQFRREQIDGLADALYDWVHSCSGEFSSTKAILEGLKLDASKLTKEFQSRVGMALQKLGCSRKEMQKNAFTGYVYSKPEGGKKNAAG
ncbi:MAG: virulence-associated E family protein [Burkholderiales bacterium]